jgi:hypothetical protein
MNPKMFVTGMFPAWKMPDRSVSIEKVMIEASARMVS